MRNVRALVWLMALVVVLQLVGCVEVIPVSSNDGIEGLRTLVENPIAPRPAVGQTWLVTTAYRANTISVDTDIATTDLDTANVYEAFMTTGMPTQPIEAMILDEIWAESITWQFRVIEADVMPSKGSRYYDLSMDESNEPQTITVLEATIDSEHGVESTVKDLAPLFHLVLRSSDYRLLALEVSYQFENGRRSELIDITDPQHSNFAAQLDADHALLDFVIPEFPLDDEANEQMTTMQLDSGAVEVSFTSVVDGSLVVQRWDAGQPWYTYSRCDDRFSWLVR